MKKIARFHLPGLFEFYELYKAFLHLFHEHREYFYPWCEIGSIYGAPSDSLWGGGRVGFGEVNPYEVSDLMKEYGISARLTFSNSLIREEHLSDKRCNKLCEIFHKSPAKNGIIIYSDLLLSHLKKNYPDFYFVSSTTKVITDSDALNKELSRDDFRYVVPDFRFNKRFDFFEGLSSDLKNKVELLCNECCSLSCVSRHNCYENVSRKALGESCDDHICTSPNASDGYLFSRAMESPAFIGIDDIINTYLPMGISEFKIEGRSLGSALILEFLLYYMTKPDCQLKVREKIYLSNTLDLF